MKPCICEGGILFYRIADALYCCFCQGEITRERLAANGYAVAPDGLPIRCFQQDCSESLAGLERR